MTTAAGAAPALGGVYLPVPAGAYGPRAEPEAAA